MMRDPEITTAKALLAAYDAFVARGGNDARDAQRMRAVFQERTGSFGAEDPWFEARTRAFWDDALTTQGLAELAAAELDAPGNGSASLTALARRFRRAHRGLFVVAAAAEREVRLDDVWSGASLLVEPLDEAQALALEHEGAVIDGRVVASSDDGPLFLLPGVFHHPPEALGDIGPVLAGARAAGLGAGDTLDALLRMERVFRGSSRVRPSFAYRVESLPHP